MTVRPAAVAGSFYSDKAEGLQSQVDTLLAGAANTVDDLAVPVKALIVPHAGYIYSGPVAATAYRLLVPLQRQIRRVVLLGPSHHVYLRSIAAPLADWFATPLGKIKVDREGLQQLIDRYSLVRTHPSAHIQEHSLEVQLPFLQQTLESFSILPLLIGDIDPAALVPILNDLAEDEGSLIIVSSDLSHFLDYATARQLDQCSAESIVNLHWAAIKPHQACGVTAIQGLLQLAKQQNLHVELLDVRNSGDTAGTRDRVVGYGSFSFATREPELGSKEKSTLSQLAKQSIQHGLHHHQAISISGSSLSATLSQPGASFVTLFHKQQLRGCIGSLTAYRTLAKDVAENAFAAAFHDPRFRPLSPAEAEDLDIHLSVLSRPVDLVVRDEAELLRLLHPGVDGLILRDGPQHSTFLPSVWEQLPEKADFLQHLKMKAGLAANHWSQSIRFQRYRTQNWC